VTGFFQGGIPSCDGLHDGGCGASPKQWLKQLRTSQLRLATGLEARLGLAIRDTPCGLLPGGPMGLLLMTPRRGSRSVVVRRRAGHQSPRIHLLWVYLWVPKCLPARTSGTFSTAAVRPVAPPNPWMVVPLAPFERLSQRADESQLRGILRICVKDRYATSQKSLGYCVLRGCPIHGQHLAGLASPHRESTNSWPGDGGRTSPMTIQIEEKSLYQDEHLRPVTRPMARPMSVHWDGQAAQGAEHMLVRLAQVL